VKKLRSLGIDQGWAGSLEGLLHRDLADVNRRLSQACQRHSELLAIGSVNLQLPDWEDDLRRCVEDHKMPGVRLHPNYHGYTLDDSRFVELLERATAMGRFVQVAAAMEDTRTQHPMLRAAEVDLVPLADVMPSIAGARVQILNCRPASLLLETLAKTPGLFFDTARVEGTDGVPHLIKRAGPGRVMFGSHAPFLIPEAALIRVHESGQLDEAALREVLSQNAERVRGNITT
jgi:predicted TIM-barrel fold metal-dependent hydrolase